MHVQATLVYSSPGTNTSKIRMNSQQDDDHYIQRIMAYSWDTWETPGRLSRYCEIKMHLYNMKLWTIKIQSTTLSSQNSLFPTREWWLINIIKSCSKEINTKNDICGCHTYVLLAKKLKFYVILLTKLYNTFIVHHVLFFFITHPPRDAHKSRRKTALN